MVPHVAPDVGDEVQAALPEPLAQRVADIALVGVELARERAGHLVEHGAVGGVAGGDPQRHDLALVVDHEVQLEPIEHPRLVLPRAARPSKTLWRWMRRVWGN